VINNILITRLQNIGDMLVFVPALRFLRQALPDANITLLCKHQGGIEIIKNCPYYDDMLIVKNRSLKEKIRLITQFRKRKLDAFIISPQDLGRCPWGFMGGAKKIIGFPEVLYRGKWKSEKLPSLLSGDAKWDVEASETENSVNLVKNALDVLGVSTEINSSLETEYSWFAPDSPAKVAEKFDVDSSYLTIAPFSKQENKNWSFDKLTALIKELQNKTKAKIILTGATEDVEKCCRLAEFAGSGCFSLAGQFSLDQSAWLISRSKLFFGPDSGPAHLATAVKTPAVVVYGPADYKRWRTAKPAAPRTDLLGTDGDVNNISVDEVLKACINLIS
jgi:ADP-heptose:LPS heptosyltransferase